MIWILALLCLGLGAFAGYLQGPIRGAASLIGVTLGGLLAQPLSPLVRPLLPALGVKHPLWLHTLPPVICFLAVAIICSVTGSVIYRKVTVRFKYADEDDVKFYRWQRFCQRVGLCTGLFTGAFYFFILMLPIYIGGYFTTELAAAQENNPPSVKMINNLRSQLHDAKLDGVLAAYDPLPDFAYQASDTLALVLQNPLLESRLSHYPVFMSLNERPEFRDLATDLEFQKLFQTHQSVGDLLNYPKVQAIVQNPVIGNELVQLLGSDLGDLNEYLRTGKSPKYDGEKILGSWVANPEVSAAEERKKLTNQTVTQLLTSKARVMSQVYGLTLTATTDNQAILKKESSPTQPPTILAKGTWKKNGEKYEISLPDNQPESAELVLQGDNTVTFPRNGLTVVMDKE